MDFTLKIVQNWV